MHRLTGERKVRAGMGEPRPAIRIGVVDSGVNPWHSHVSGGVYGCRFYMAEDGSIREDDDIRDLVGHGTAVAGILRQQLPDAEIFAVRVFERDLTSYPSLVARGVLRAAAEGCSFINLSLAMPLGPGAELLYMACAEAMEAGCVIVSAGHAEKRVLLPASIPGVLGVVADDRVPEGEIRVVRGRSFPYAATGRPRELERAGHADNFWGNSFACARVTAHFAAQALGKRIGSFGELN
jgi:subtilisin family serine protease